jgi:hypothetical protein
VFLKKTSSKQTHMPTFTYCDGKVCGRIDCEASGGTGDCPTQQSWEWLQGHAAVITLRDDPNSVKRHASFRQAIAPLGLDSLWRDRPLVRGALVTRHPEGGVVGCFTSHQAVLQQMLDRDAQWGLVFEDDARPYPGAARRALVEELGQFAQARAADPAKAAVPTVIQLGYAVPPTPFANGSGTALPGFPTIIPVRKTYLAHAYVANAAAMRAIVAMTPDIDYDAAVGLRKRMPADFEQFVLEPMMMMQCACASSVTPGSIWVQNTLSMKRLQDCSRWVTLHPFGYSAVLLVVALAFALLIVVAAQSWGPQSRSSTRRRVAGTSCGAVGTLGLVAMVAGLLVLPLAMGIL